MLYTILKQFLLPPGVLILMLAAAFFLARGVMARLLIFSAASILLLLSMPTVSTALMVPLEPYGAIADPAAVDTEVQGILVLGAGRVTRAPEYGGDSVDALSMERIRYGAYLACNTGLPLYLSGGAQPHETRSVAELMRDVAQDELGVEVAGIEPQSRTSWENAAYSRSMLEQDGIDHVLLVSSAWHLARAVEVFEQAGIAITPAPTGFHNRPGGESRYTDWLPSARAFFVSYYATHEHLGRLWYQLRLWWQGAPSTDGSVEGEVDPAPVRV